MFACALSPSLSHTRTYSLTFSCLPEPARRFHPAPGASVLTLLLFIFFSSPFPLLLCFVLSGPFPPLYITILGATGTDKEGVSPRTATDRPGLPAPCLRANAFAVHFHTGILPPPAVPSLNSIPPAPSHLFRLFSLPSYYTKFTNLHHHRDPPSWTEFPAKPCAIFQQLLHHHHHDVRARRHFLLPKSNPLRLRPPRYLHRGTSRTWLLTCPDQRRRPPLPLLVPTTYHGDGLVTISHAP